MLKAWEGRVFLLLAAACSFIASPSFSAERYRVPGARSGFVTTTDRVRIHYLEAGPQPQAANRPAILFVPGWTMPAEIWEPQLTHFGRVRRVVAMDPRSQGLSSGSSDGNYPEVRARDIKAVVDHLKLAPAVLVGWSLAVKELVAYVRQFGCDTIAGIVLVDGAAGLDPTPEALRDLLARAVRLQRDRHAETARFVHGMYKKPHPSEYLDRITRDSLRTPTNTAIVLMLEYLASDFRPDLGKITRPALIVATTGPYTYVAENTQKRIPQARLELMDGVGHALFVDDPARFNKLLEDFLAKL